MNPQNVFINNKEFAGQKARASFIKEAPTKLAMSCNERRCQHILRYNDAKVKNRSKHLF